MNKLTALHLAGFAALTAFAAPRAAEEEFAFRPAAGQKLVFTFDSSLELELVEMTSVFTQGDETQEMDPEGVERTLTQQEKIVLSDEIVEEAEGKVTKLRRTFDEISQTGKDEQVAPEDSRSNDLGGTSGLEGTTVLFTWDADEESYTAAFEGEGGDEDLLADLEAKLDFSELLPGGPVSKDDTWTVEASVFNGLTSPGGELHVLMEGEEPDEEGGMDDQIEANMAGEISCTLTDVREEEGARIAVIAVTVKLASHGSEEDTLEEEQVGTVEIAVEAAVTFELEGELLWDLTAGHASSFSLSGEMTYDSKQKQEVEAMSLSIEQTQLLEGTFTYSARVE